MPQHGTELAGGSSRPHETRLDQLALEHIEQALRGLEFGEVTVTVQDGVAVQIERTERKRVRGATRKR